MSYTIIFPIKELAVDLVQIFHTFCQVGVGCFDHQMVMVTHKAVDVAQPVEPLDGGVQDVEILDPISIFKEYHHPLITPAYDMVKSALELDP